jgi:dUTP pyrophosphatase
MLRVKLKKLSENAVIPFYANPTDAGMDLTATSIQIVEEKDYGYISYGTGLAFEIPVGYVGLIFPRSSISKTGLVLANSVGVIDSGYRGEVSCRFKWVRGTEFYKVGDRIAQIIIIPHPHTTFIEEGELSDSQRGEGGYGSTGN